MQDRAGGLRLVPTVTRLKFTILRNSLISGKLGSIWSISALTATILGSIYGVLRMFADAAHPNESNSRHLILMLTSIFGLWVFGPLLVGGVDDSLDPHRLALFPLSRREMRSALVIGVICGPVPLATIISVTGATVAYRASGAMLALSVVAGVVAMALNVCMSRALSVTLAFASKSRRGKDLSILLASLGAAAIFLGTQSLRFLSTAQQTRVFGMLSQLPPGQMAKALLDFRSGDFVTGCVRVTVMAALCAFSFLVWMRGIDRLLVESQSRHQSSIRSSRRRVTERMVDPEGLVSKIRAHPVFVLAAKDFRYLRRSPQRRSSLIISVVIGTVFALLQSMRDQPTNPTAVFGAVVAALFGVHATNNLLGTDAASLWLEQTAGTRIKDQLIARGLAASPNLIIPTILAGAVLAAISGGWREFLMLAVCSIGLMGLPLGVGSVISVLAPFNQPDSGNPYSNKRAANSRGGLVSVLALVGILSVGVGALLPVGGLALAWMVGNPLLLTVAIACTVPYSYLCWRMGLTLALRLIRGKEIELLATIGGRSALV